MALYMAVKTLSSYPLEYVAPQFTIDSVIFCAIDGLIHSCSGDGFKISLAVQRDFLTQRSSLVFDTSVVGPVRLEWISNNTALHTFFDGIFLELTGVSLTALDATFIF